MVGCALHVVFCVQMCACMPTGTSGTDTALLLPQQTACVLLQSCNTISWESSYEDQEAMQLHTTLHQQLDYRHSGTVHAQMFIPIQRHTPPVLPTHPPSPADQLMLAGH